MRRGILLLALFFVASCDSNNPSTEALMLIDEIVVDSAQTRVLLYAEAEPAVGYNTFYIELQNSDENTLNDAHVSVMPTMHMTSMSHSCPYEAPTAEGRRFRTAVIFQMASNETEYWTLEVSFHNHENDLEGTAQFTFPVAASNCVKMATVNSTPYLVVLKNPMHPQVGLNDLEVAWYKRQSMMSFPAITTGNITFEPSMPSMGHGSPNNVNPVHDAVGIYEGKVNFTMTGDWLLEVQSIVAADTVNVAFDVVVE